MSALTGEMLRAFRERHGLSQAALAEELGVAENTIRNYETQRRSDRPSVAIPRVVDWALSALDGNLRPFSALPLKKER